MLDLSLVTVSVILWSLVPYGIILSYALLAVLLRSFGYSWHKALTPGLNIYLFMKLGDVYKMSYALIGSIVLFLIYDFVILNVSPAILTHSAVKTILSFSSMLIPIIFAFGYVYSCLAAYNISKTDNNWANIGYMILYVFFLPVWLLAVIVRGHYQKAVTTKKQ